MRNLPEHGIGRRAVGVAEQPVPFIISQPLTAEYAARAAGSLRNFDIFEFALNGCEDSGGAAGA